MKKISNGFVSIWLIVFITIISLNLSGLFLGINALTHAMTESKITHQKQLALQGAMDRLILEVKNLNVSDKEVFVFDEQSLQFWHNLTTQQWENFYQQGKAKRWVFGDFNVVLGVVEQLSEEGLYRLHVMMPESVKTMMLYI